MADVAGLGDDRRGQIAADPVDLLEWIAVIGEQLGDLGVEGCDALVEVLDVAGKFADAARGGALRKAVAEMDPGEVAQGALAVSAQNAGFRDRILLCPVRAQPLDRLGAVADEPAALQLEHAERADELGLLSRPS